MTNLFQLQCQVLEKKYISLNEDKFSTDNILKLHSTLNMNIKSLLRKKINITFGNNNTIKKILSSVIVQKGSKNDNAVYNIPCRDCSECLKCWGDIDFSR